MASVNWISLVLSGSTFFNFLKILLFKIYLPQTAILDGASLALGFSTISNISIVLFWEIPGFITPYLWISFESTLLTAITEWLES